MVDIIKKYGAALGIIYGGVGVINSFYLWATVNLSDCAVADGILSTYCNVGTGISHLVSIALWPLFWIS